MVREAIVSALKHAHPSRVSVDVLALNVDTLQIIVSNDGSGFRFLGRRDHEALFAAGGGPESLRDRVESMGGSLAIESMPTGSRVEITIPVTTQNA